MIPFNVSTANRLAVVSLPLAAKVQDGEHGKRGIFLWTKASSCWGTSKLGTKNHHKILRDVDCICPTVFLSLSALDCIVTGALVRKEAGFCRRYILVHKQLKHWHAWACLVVCGA